MQNKRLASATRSDYGDFKNNPVFTKLISLLNVGEQAAVDYYVETGTDTKWAIKTYREIREVLLDGDVLVDEEAA